MYDPDYCDECIEYGDNYYVDENGELVSACNICFNKVNDYDDDDW